jgi:GDP-L-fucose synthase
MKDQDLKIFVAGHNGMVGSAIVRLLKRKGYKNIITADRHQLDLLDQSDVSNFFKDNKPDQVYLSAAKVGGIHANNTYPADFIYQNLTIQNNIIHQSFINGAKKLLFLGSSCIYPRENKQPIEESDLMTGVLESTNEPYAIAKIAGIKMCESYNRQFGLSHNIDFRSIMPTNLYGPGDNYNSENSHVIPALIKRFHDAKINNFQEVIVWGSGNPKREFLHVDDMADASVFVMELAKKVYKENTNPMQGHINVGSGFDVSIKKLAEIIANEVGYKGIITFDTSKPDGTERKLMSSKKINNIGWSPKITTLAEGIKITYKDFCLRESS